MKKAIYFLLFILSFNANAQDFLGYLNSNYAGVNGIDLQPASIVDNRYKLDILLLANNSCFQNNFFHLKQGFMQAPLKDIRTDYLGYDKEKMATSFILSNQIQGPSFMFTINEKNSIAFNSKARVILNMDNVSTEFLRQLHHNYDVPELWGKSFLQNGFNLQGMAWGEFGLTYGREVYKTKHHYFKSAVRVKMLQGYGAFHLNSPASTIKIENDSTLTISNSDILSYGHSANFDDGKVYFNPFDPNATIGWGGDFGVVYEWRPRSEKHSYEMDGERKSARDENKYKLKVGFSLLDLGTIRFKRGSHTKDFNPNISHWDVKDIDPTDLVAFDSTVNANFPPLPSEPAYNVNLPTALSVQVDYNIWKNFYINATAFQAIKFNSKATKIHEISNYSITPRWDYKWFGVYVPVSFNEMGTFRVGASAMFGPFFFGTNNLGPLYQAEMKGVDFFVGIKVSSLHHKESDSDEDKVSNKNDDCEDIAGLWKFKGCPDTDGDSIPDKDDACPKIPGLKEFKGCPDTDKDGIEDMKDDCVEIPGLKEFNGCPDTDGDKIIDKNDSCATVKGLAIYNGCPDSDGDSIIDSKDACPTLAGPRINNGCPDTDGDGILDNEDDCITVKGLRENRGCPEKDEDGDGVIDKIDDCPKTAGPAENKGCPVLQKEEVEILKLAFSNLEFETGKAIIKNESFASLDTLAALLVKKSTWKLKLAGHTDNVGDKAKNMKLSKDRTEAVAKYLASKGVSVSNLIVEYFGPNKPIASNKTPEGRQKNRRVEMNIIFE